MEREVGGGIGRGNTCKPMAVSFQCMTKSTTIKKKKERKFPTQMATVESLGNTTVDHNLSNINVYINYLRIFSDGGSDLARLGQYLEKAMAPHSSTLAWKIPWTEEPGRLQSIESL